MISCIITGNIRYMYSADLPQGGLEVPCSLVLSGNPSIVKKLRGVLSTSVKESEVSEVVRLQKEERRSLMLREKKS